MTTEQIKMVKELSGCTFLPGSPPKRFVKQLFSDACICPERELSEKQASWLKTLHHQYRNQINRRKALAS